MKILLVIGFIIFTCSTGNTADEQQAYKQATLAAFKQSGAEDMISKYVDKELKAVPEEIKVMVSNVYLIGKTIQDRKISHTWSY